MGGGDGERNFESLESVNVELFSDDEESSDQNDEDQLGNEEEAFDDHSDADASENSEQDEEGERDTEETGNNNQYDASASNDDEEEHESNDAVNNVNEQIPNQNVVPDVRILFGEAEYEETILNDQEIQNNQTIQNNQGIQNNQAIPNREEIRFPSQLHFRSTDEIQSDIRFQTKLREQSRENILLQKREQVRLGLQNITRADSHAIFYHQSSIQTFNRHIVLNCDDEPQNKRAKTSSTPPQTRNSELYEADEIPLVARVIEISTSTEDTTVTYDPPEVTSDEEMDINNLEEIDLTDESFSFSTDWF